MTTDQFLTNFGYVANAPEGVKRLQELTLFLAITGDLSTPKKGDSDAVAITESALDGKLRYFEKRKTRVSRNKKVDLTQMTRRLPRHWKLVQAGELVHLINGRAFKSDDWRSSGLPIIRIQNLNNPRAPFNYFQGEVSANHRVTHGDMLLSWSGTPGTSFGAFIWSGGDAALNQHIFKVHIYSDLLDKAFLKMAINASLDALIGGARGGVGLKHVTKGQIDALLIPIPPVEEQKRIVMKVDELMALCDQLDAQQQERERCFPVLSQTCHARFSEAPTLANINRIFNETSTVSPTDIRKSILSLAVEGKLAVGSSVASERKPVKLKEVCEQITDGEHATPQRISSGVPLATAKNIRDGFLDMSQTDYVAQETAEKCWNRCRPKDGDILMVCVGATTGRLCLLRNPPDMVLVRSVALLRPNTKRIESMFLNLFLRSPSGQSQVWSGVRQNAQPCLYLGKMSEFLISLPSLEEQRRIVTKVEELMPLVDHLEAQQQERDRLAEALAKACVASFTGRTQIERPRKMKAPKTELVSLVKLGKKPKAGAMAPLARLLSEHKAELSAKALWQQSGLSIDAFYLQLKTEVSQGWIARPDEAEMKILEEN